MHHDMKPTLPANESKYFEAFNRITTARNENELKVATQDAVTAMKDYFESKPLDDLKESAIALSKNLENQEVRDKFQENFDMYLYATAVEDGRYVSSQAHKDDYYYVKKLRAKIIEENKITSQTEMIIVDMAVISYFRYLRISNLQIRLVSQIGAVAGKDLQPKVNLLKQYDRQIEASYDQFVRSITLLKELRQPKLNVKIHSKETFVAQNQQFNKNA